MVHWGVWADASNHCRRLGYSHYLGTPTRSRRSANGHPRAFRVPCFSRSTGPNLTANPHMQAASMQNQARQSLTRGPVQPQTPNPETLDYPGAPIAYRFSCSIRQSPQQVLVFLSSCTHVPPTLWRVTQGQPTLRPQAPCFWGFEGYSEAGEVADEGRAALPVTTNLS